MVIRVMKEYRSSACHGAGRQPALLGCALASRLPISPALALPQVVFCGPECRAAALSAYHAVECPVLRQLVPADDGGELSPMALLAFRIVVRAAGLGGPDWRRTLAAGLPPDFARLHLAEDEGEDKGKKKRRARKAASGQTQDGWVYLGLPS